MARFSIREFGPSAPRFEPTLLPENLAQSAINCRLLSGALEPLPGMALEVTTAAPVQSLHYYEDGQFLGWSTPGVDVVRSPVAGDVDHRIYWSGDGYPKWSKRGLLAFGALRFLLDTANCRRLGVPAPTVKASVSLSGSPPTVTPVSANSSAGSQPKQWNEYVYCWIYLLNGQWWRTSPSASARILVTAKQAVYVANLDTLPPAHISASAQFVQKRLFRRDAGGDYRKVMDMPITQEGMTDTVLTANLGVWIEVLPFDGTAITLTAPSVIPDDRALMGDVGTFNTVTTLYAYAYVSAEGEEGPLGPLSNRVLRESYHHVTVLIPAPAGWPDALPKARLYRADSSGNFRFVADVTFGAGDFSFEDELVDEQLGELCSTSDYDPPPANLAGLVSLPGGVLAGFSGNELCFSVPNLPYAWPVKYRLTVDAPIVALGVSDNGLLVTTERWPYVCMGLDPAAMSLTRIDEAQACMSKRSMVDMGSAVMYASPNGLVAAAGMSMKVVSEEFMTPTQWRALNPASMVGFLVDGMYLLAFEVGATRSMLLWNPQRPGFIEILADVKCGCFDPATGVLYVQSAGAVYRWARSATPLAASWLSRRLLLPGLMCPAAVRVSADAYPVTLTLYASTGPGSETPVQVAQVSVADSRPMKLPAGYLSRVFEVSVDTTATVRAVEFASSAAEFVAARA